MVLHKTTSRIIKLEIGIFRDVIPSWCQEYAIFQSASDGNDVGSERDVHGCLPQHPRDCYFYFMVIDHVFFGLGEFL